MLTVFFNAKGIIHSSRICAGDKFYKEVIKRSIARVHCVWPGFQERWSPYLLQYNAPAHSSGDVSVFLANLGIPVLSHPPYSPNLFPADFFLFPKLKITKEWTRFEAVSSIQQTVTRELKATREEAFSRAFDSLYEQRQRAEEGGDYIE
jgi:hypothetical protein